jgi:histidine ammonia-lyase
MVTTVDTDTSLVLGGPDQLTVGPLARAARDGAIGVELHPTAVDRMHDNATLATAIAQRNRNYGRTTGVGANRHVEADNSDGAHGSLLAPVRSFPTTSAVRS